MAEGAPNMLHFWYSRQMHQFLMKPNWGPNADQGGYGSDFRPGRVQILPDGTVATLVSEAPHHGSLWPDVRLVTRADYRTWRSVPADKVPLGD